tara:strand:- start:422 stop:577 length:156 start_codon:yes stop_codon:yes gene_type:complete
MLRRNVRLGSLRVLSEEHELLLGGERNFKQCAQQVALLSESGATAQLEIKT